MKVLSTLNEEIKSHPHPSPSISSSNTALHNKKPKLCLPSLNDGISADVKSIKTSSQNIIKPPHHDSNYQHTTPPLIIQICPMTLYSYHHVLFSNWFPWKLTSLLSYIISNHFLAATPPLTI